MYLFLPFSTNNRGLPQQIVVFEKKCLQIQTRFQPKNGFKRKSKYFRKHLKPRAFITGIK